jgi:hypothetical protein
LGFEPRYGHEICLFSKKGQTGSGVRPISYSVVTGFFLRGYSRRVVKLTTRLHLVWRLRMSGAVPLLRLHTSTHGQGKLHLCGVSKRMLCLKGKDHADINSKFAHWTGQITDVSSTTNSVFRASGQVQCTAFLQIMAARYRKI